MRVSAGECMKAVIPAGGLGTRFLPATKSIPKEMLPVIDKPVIQYVVEEAVSAGIDDIIIITGKGKRAIEDYFDRNFELEHILEREGNYDLLKKVRDVADVDIHYVRQKEQKGLGDAVYCARKHVGDEPFAVLLGDDIIVSEVPCIQQLMGVYEEFRCSVVALEEVPLEKVSNYGIIKGRMCRDSLYKIEELIEKPEIAEAPSTLSIPGRYILTPRIFECIEKTPFGKGNEIQLTDALNLLLGYEDIYGLKFKGKRYDIGTKFGYIKATIEFALQREDLKDRLGDFLNSLELQ